jgi:hypothetical protein
MSNKNRVSMCLDKPVFTEEPTDISADKGQVVKLTCAADGSPAPSYIWYRNSDINQVQLRLRALISINHHPHESEGRMWKWH